ncbi:MAG: hypothetical protein ACKVVT_12095 [Dehalococcoidia bacterium]
MKAVSFFGGGAVVLALFYIWLSTVVAYFGGDIWPLPVHHSWALPDSWSEWRDVAIIFSTLFWALAGLVLLVLLGVLTFLAFAIKRLLEKNVAPAVDSLKASLDNVRGTTEFAGETVVSPLIRAYSVVKGVRTGMGAITGVGDRIRGRKQGKKR